MFSFISREHERSEKPCWREMVANIAKLDWNNLSLMEEQPQGF